MPGLLLTGVNSAICRELREMILPVFSTVDLTRDQCEMSSQCDLDFHSGTFRNSDRIVLAHGTLSAEEFLGRDDCGRSLDVNLLSVITICETALQYNPKARICVIGSESATKGSRDIPYWMAKAGLHSYVRERRLEHPGQQLVCVAPSAVADTGMTAQKTEAEIAAAIAASPKQRLVTPAEVARLIHFLLFVDEGYITNTVVEINGGKFARRTS